MGIFYQDLVILTPFYSRGTDITAEIDSLKNLNHRIPLNESSLPSICCYTFHNTHDR